MNAQAYIIVMQPVGDPLASPAVPPVQAAPLLRGAARGAERWREEWTEDPPTPLCLTASQGSKPSRSLTAGQWASINTAAIVSPDSSEPHHHHQPVSNLVYLFLIC